MTTPMWAFGKANPSNSLRLSKYALKQYSTATATAPPNGNATHPKPVDAATQRELFMNVLNTNATKRDAKPYLARFKPPKTQPSNLSQLQEERNARYRADQDRLDRTGVNLGRLYTPARAIADSAQFFREGLEEKTAIELQQTIHVALVCLRAPEMLHDSTLDGVAQTLSQLVKLDMRVVLTLDPGSHYANRSLKVNEVKKLFAEQGDRLNRAIAKHNPEGARLINGAIEIQDSSGQQNVAMGLPNLVLDPLKRSVIPILPTLAYTQSGQMVDAPTSDIMSAVSLMLSNLSKPSSLPPDDKVAIQTSLDRIILLDSIGGIPSKARGDGAHVFINLEQEFNDIQEELHEYSDSVAKEDYPRGLPDVYHQHRSNLHMLQKCLAMLPPASSALIVTPEEAASSSQTGNAADSTIGAGTRRQKNTIIHNLLTNKPMVSSSLPAARMPSTADANGEPSTPRDTPRSTLVKRGMPLNIIPAVPRRQGWQVPTTGRTDLNLETDPRVNLPRLVYLIEDSFRRKLDLQHYLSRIQNRIAGLIIAGSYEGGAILTWEQPPGTSDPSRLVPYLDKFAVLSTSQGSSGVADILFQAMVRTCFPNGVCWRSRKDNPVNKWYFERADGHWQIPGTNWTMFWTGEGVVENPERWEDYVGVCRSVGASWADGKRPD